ncbi:MAG: MutT/nudix family protein [candidate division WWE3 bacterium GW2011_GWC2_44_9]|uniref:MutT/nudix family protein n=1 Tax=candidate division WWE3 bacterium GW2011_GWC2_44_9 TaxID=1619125 RepID=A0A0G1KJT2_UNCKA|nr:MAG: MutT/nudix family protein [Candidatus Roizmanbacteria bacterium GW2011_GWC1_37_12]KKT83966.1 MAG: MutT/nudix family protein [candidate division WWE3 bacterium GW2011_GWC2_44_9]
MKVIYQTSAGGIVYKGNLWLITQHSQHKGWVFPKGLVGDKDGNESMEKAALREVEEESGIKAKIIIDKPIITNYEYKWNGDLIKKTVYYFFMEYISGDPKNHDWEMMDAKFVSADEVKNTLTYKSDREAFEKIWKTVKHD